MTSTKSNAYPDSLTPKILRFITNRYQQRYGAQPTVITRIFNITLSKCASWNENIVVVNMLAVEHKYTGPVEAISMPHKER